MKKTAYEHMELQLQEYDWQVDAVSDMHIEWGPADMPPAAPAVTENDSPGYRH
jgi:hypothetical protein